MFAPQDTEAKHKHVVEENTTWIWPKPCGGHCRSLGDLYLDTEDERDTSTSVTMHKTASKDCGQTQLDGHAHHSQASSQKQKHVFRMTNKQDSTCGADDKEANEGNVADTNAIDDDRNKERSD